MNVDTLRSNTIVLSSEETVDQILSGVLTVNQNVIDSLYDTKVYKYAHTRDTIKEIMLTCHALSVEYKDSMSEAVEQGILFECKTRYRDWVIPEKYKNVRIDQAVGVYLTHMPMLYHGKAAVNLFKSLGLRGQILDYIELQTIPSGAVLDTDLNLATALQCEPNTIITVADPDDTADYRLLSKVETVQLIQRLANNLVEDDIFDEYDDRSIGRTIRILGNDNYLKTFATTHRAYGMDWPGLASLRYLADFYRSDI